MRWTGSWLVVGGALSLAVVACTGSSPSLRPKTFRPTIVPAPPPPASRPPPPPSDAIGPAAPWLFVTSQHFTLRANVSASTAHVYLGIYEALYTELHDLAFPTLGPEPRRLELYIVHDEDEYVRYAPAASDGVFGLRVYGAAYPEPSPVVVLRQHLSAAAKLQFLHELTHHFVRRRFGSVSRWLNEGLAEYLETTRVTDGRAVLGDFLPTLGGTKAASPDTQNAGSFVRLLVPVDRVPELDAMLSMKPDDFYAHQKTDEASKLERSANYLGAWALVHVLMNGPVAYQERFSKMLDAIAEKRIPTRLAFEDAFRDVKREDLAHDYRAMIEAQTTTAKATAYEMPASGATSEERLLTEAEIHEMRGRLLPWTGADPTATKEELDRAVAAAPGNPLMRLARGAFEAEQHRDDAAREDLEAARDALPSDHRARYALAALNRQTDDPDGNKKGETARLRKAYDELAEVAGTAHEEFLLAWRELRRRKTDAGIGYAKRAIELDAACTQCLDAMAMLLAQKRQFDDAIAFETRAIETLPEEVDDADLTKRRDELVARAEKARKPKR